MWNYVKYIDIYNRQFYLQFECYATEGMAKLRTYNNSIGLELH